VKAGKTELRIELFRAEKNSVVHAETAGCAVGSASQVVVTKGESPVSVEGSYEVI
jgi:hypothetical protein